MKDNNKTGLKVEIIPKEAKGEKFVLSLSRPIKRHRGDSRLFYVRLCCA